ncbi:MAG TPA: spore coat U domain-containing protein [Steroidobacteraceae bacterium]|nr:spore coat U domain-containing protein [Steroidobacteraceae bacterium]
MSARSLRLVLSASLALPMLAHAAACSVTVVNVGFGGYDVFQQQDTETTGSVNVTCDSSASYAISLSAGFGTFAARAMSNGSQQLDYNLFTDPQRLTIWGDGTSGTVTVSATGTGGTYTVYGMIPALQNVPAGSYSDTITVTVTY